MFMMNFFLFFCMLVPYHITYLISTKTLYVTSQLRKYKYQFSANHKQLYDHKIPPFYKDMHMLFMKYFKLHPVNLMDILTQSLWLNNNVTTNKELLYWTSWEDQRIAQLKDILNNHNLYLTHDELKNKYNIRITYMRKEMCRSTILFTCVLP